MKRINGMVADEAKDVLVSWKNKKGFTTQDEALENLLIEFKEICAQLEQEYQADVVAQIEHENKEPDED